MTNDVQLKASPATSSSSSASFEPTAANTQADPITRPRSRHSRLSSNVSKRRSPRSNSADFLSDWSTAQLIRRVLCPQQISERGRATLAPVDELLPPLTSRNDVDLQLYAIISIIIRDFVQTWYNKITPDETFIAEIVQIIAHCTRALEQRLRKVDVESLILDELPELLDNHIQAYRASRKPIIQPPIEVDPREIYHSLRPLPYLSPIPKLDKPGSISEQAENEVAYRQLLVQGVLAVLLPTEDLENECLTSLVGQIFSESIIGGVVAKKASEPWMIWTGLTILADVIRRRKTDANGQGLEQNTTAAQGAKSFSINGLFWSLVHYTFIFVAVVRMSITMFAMCRTTTPRGQSAPPRNEELTRHKGESQRINTDTPSLVECPSEAVHMPILACGIWPTISNLIEMDQRMPWLCGCLSLFQWLAIAGPGRVAGFDGVVDRLLSDSIHRSILDPAILSTALRNLRGVLFPHNAMGAQTLSPPESDQELLALRRRCASALWTLVPRGVGRLYFGGTASSWLAKWSTGSSSTSPRSGPITNSGGVGHRPEKTGEDLDLDLDARIITEIETGILDVFSDPYCNKHLMYSALELILVRLMPELAEKGVVELWEERLS